LRDSSDDPLIVDGLLNGNFNATRTPREIREFVRKTREKPPVTMSMSYASRKRLRPLKTLDAVRTMPIG